MQRICAILPATKKLTICDFKTALKCGIIIKVYRVKLLETEILLMSEFDILKRKALEKYFSGLNDMQRKAVFKVHGPLLILAGAGSGKTTVLINRIANMIYFGDAYTYEDTREHTPAELDFLRAYAAGEVDEAGELSQIVSHGCIVPWNILAITFTNKAANELKDRLERMLGEQGVGVTAATFHSACARILRRECERLGYKPSFTIYDTDDCLRLIKQALKELDISDKIFPPRAMLSAISAQKNKMISPDKYYEMYKNEFREREIAKIYKLYNSRLFEANAMDFDDLLCNVVKLFEENDDVLLHYQNLYKYILVDEYQDTNTVQFRLIDLLAARHNNLCVVGDDDQSIYKFRGATIENILSFEKTFDCDPDTDVIRLEQNYRSTQNILTTANVLIGNNQGRKGKNLWTDLGEGEKVVVYNALNERSEARFIAETIKKNVEAGMKYRDHAVLYRMNAQSNIIEQVFVREGIPYVVFGGQKFYERKEIKDIIAYLAVINNRTDTLRLRRIINEPKRGIGDATAAAVEQIASDLGVGPLEVMRDSASYAPIAKKSKALTGFYELIETLDDLSQEMKPSELLTEVLERSGYGEMLRKHGDEGLNRLENIAELRSTMVNYEENVEEPTIEGFLEEISLYTDIDKYDESEDYAALMTIHSSKGLEFDCVFIPGMEENVFPSARSSDNPEDLEEERRLAYVAITRARKKLYLMHSTMRMLYGRTGVNRPSRFLAELPEENTEHIKEESKLSSEARKRPQKPDYSHEASDVLARRKSSIEHTGESGSFKAGDRLRHPKFGDGTVLSAENMGNTVLLEVAFDECGTKKIMPFKNVKKI